MKKNPKNKDSSNALQSDNANMRSYYPNQLGRIHISISKQQVSPVEVDINKNDTLNDITPKDSNKIKKCNRKTIDDIWRHLGLGDINISYACIGYTLDGRPVLNYDEFANLLVTYGFNINDVVAFIEDFASHSLKDNNAPIVMFTSNSSAIMTNIAPIV